jgi:microcystin-dependent protein
MRRRALSRLDDGNKNRMKNINVAIASIVFTSVLLGTVHVLRAEPPPSFAPGETLSAAKMNASFTQLSNRLDALEKASAVPAVPAGAVVAYGGPSAPDGWFLCDGSKQDRIAEPALFAAIGTAWGAPDDSSFNLPDLRGLFLRGVDAKTNRDPDVASRGAAAAGGNTGDAVGTLEDQQLISHAHNVPAYITGQFGQGSSIVPFNLFSADGPGLLASQAAGGNETRPKNASVNYIIKR